MNSTKRLFTIMVSLGVAYGVAYSAYAQVPTPPVGLTVETMSPDANSSSSRVVTAADEAEVKQKKAEVAEEKATGAEEKKAVVEAKKGEAAETQAESQEAKAEQSAANER